MKRAIIIIFILFIISFLWANDVYVARLLTAFDKSVNERFKPIFPVFLNHGVVLQKGTQYRAMLLTSLDLMVLEEWIPIFSVMLENGVTFKK